MNYKVIIQPRNLEIEIPAGKALMDALIEVGVAFDFPCGGKGKCRKCRIKVINGMGQPTARELEVLEEKELAKGIRLACLTKVNDNITVELLNDKDLKHNILISSEERSINIEPHIKKIFLTVDKPSLEDSRSDWNRLKDSLVQLGYDELKAPVNFLRQLPETIRAFGHQVTAVLYGQELLGIEQQDTTGKMRGMAFDIGTTTIVGYLIDIYTAKELSVVSTLNPQTKFGADVISRINFVNQEVDGLNKLHTAVVDAVNKLIGEAVEKADMSRNDIYEVSFAANTTMHHLLFGVSSRSVAAAPYVPAISEPLIINPNELQIEINQAGKIFLLPNIAGFVGADTTAVLLATEMDKSQDVKLIIDIGTNGEIVVGSSEKMVSCSAAAGPAFEGAQISSGMRGAIGAIDHVYFKDTLQFSIIGDVEPLGICGSALLDTVAGMLEKGIIDKRGKILPIEKVTNPAALAYKDNLIQHDGQAAFQLVDAKSTGNGRPIMVTQSDIRELQLAKGAMAAGVRVLMETYGAGLEDIKEVLLAGAFGNYLNPHSACVIGLIPMELESKIKMIGNAAGTGAKLALLSASEFRRAADIASVVKFVELGSYPKFNIIFAECTYFKPVS